MTCLSPHGRRPSTVRRSRSGYSTIRRLGIATLVVLWSCTSRKQARRLLFGVPAVPWGPRSHSASSSTYNGSGVVNFATGPWPFSAYCSYDLRARRPALHPAVAESSRHLSRAIVHASGTRLPRHALARTRSTSAAPLGFWPSVFADRVVRLGPARKKLLVPSARPSDVGGRPRLLRRSCLGRTCDRAAKRWYPAVRVAPLAWATGVLEEP